MDSDSSTKFIGSLTKFLQSLCNGYVEFQRGVELVGHIYLSIDTGEKVDYILHEKVSKNDENSVTFVSNSFHAQPLDKDKPENKDSPSKAGAGSKGKSNNSSDDDDIVIVDHSKGIPGSSNSGSIPSRGVKRVGSPSSSDRHAQRMRGVGGPSSGHDRGSSGFHQNNRQHAGPSATVTSQSQAQQEGLNISDVKLEQISKDELMSLASQVGEGGSRPPHGVSSTVHSHSPRTEGQVWVKQEAADDDDGGGNETGWTHGRDDSNSNSGSNLYPVMLHQNPAAYSGSAFPGFSGPGSSGANPYADPLPGTSQDSSGLDPSERRRKHSRPAVLQSNPRPRPKVDIPLWSKERHGDSRRGGSGSNGQPRNGDATGKNFDSNTRRKKRQTLLRSGDPWHPNPGLHDWDEGYVEESVHYMSMMAPLASKRNQLPLHLRVELIRQSRTKSQRQLASTFGISKTQVFAILQRKEKIVDLYNRIQRKKNSALAFKSY